jgi:hypothetical protein
MNVQNTVGSTNYFFIQYLSIFVVAKWWSLLDIYKENEFSFYFSSNFDYYYFLFELIVSRAPADFLNQTSYGFQVRLGCSTYHH